MPKPLGAMRVASWLIAATVLSVAFNRLSVSENDIHDGADIAKPLLVAPRRVQAIQRHHRAGDVCQHTGSSARKAVIAFPYISEVLFGCAYTSVSRA